MYHKSNLNISGEERAQSRRLVDVEELTICSIIRIFDICEAATNGNVTTISQFRMNFPVLLSTSSCSAGMPEMQVMKSIVR